jgi:hypothetical protein
MGVAIGERAREGTTVLSSDVIEMRSLAWCHEGTNDYTSLRTDIEAIVDRENRALTPVWERAWTTVAEGVDTRHDGRSRVVRIAAAACPVRVRFCDYHEYVSYTHREHCSKCTSCYWVRYVTAREVSASHVSS